MREKITDSSKQYSQRICSFTGLTQIPNQFHIQIGIAERYDGAIQYRLDVCIYLKSLGLYCKVVMFLLVELSLVDAHFHLTDESLSDFIDLILTAIKIMRIKVCSVCVDNQTSLRSISLISHPEYRNTVAQFVGIHPSFAKREDVVKFCSMLETNIQSIDGIGEIGLDRTYTLDNYSPYPKQLEVFELMLRLAERHHRPVSVHSRKSLDEIVQLMSTFRIQGVLLHWFSGSKKQLERCLDRGYYISYGPALLYSQDKQVLLKKTDKDKILIETDGPNRYSHCFGNFPALPSSFLTSVAKSAGEMLGMSYEETLQMLTTNWCNFVNQKL